MSEPDKRDTAADAGSGEDRGDAAPDNGGSAPDNGGSAPDGGGVERRWYEWLKDRKPADFTPRLPGTGKHKATSDEGAESAAGGSNPGREEHESVDGEPAAQLAEEGRMPEMPGGVRSGLGALGSATVTSLATVMPRRKANDPHRDADLRELGVERGGIVAAVDGLPLAVRESGPSDAPLTVVFTHGYTLTMNTWHFQRRELTRRFGDEIRMVFYDQRGHGMSEKASRKRATINQLGLDLGSVIESTAPTGPIVIVGHSMGGMTAMSYVRQHPEAVQKRLAGVGFVATASGKLSQEGLGALLDSRSVASLVKAAARAPGVFHGGRRSVRGLLTPILYGGSFGDPGSISPTVAKFVADTINATDVETMAYFFDALTRHDEHASLALLEGVHTAVVSGDRDLLTPLDRSAEIAAEFPRGQFRVVPDSGHMVMLEHPDVVNDALTDLIADSLAAIGKGRLRPGSGARL